MKVYQAIHAVQSALAKTGISKDRKNQQQGYAFRGIDDCYGAIAPLLAEHKLVIIPRGQNRTVTERETKAGGNLFYTTLDVEFDFVSAEDGSKHTARMFGEAMDSGDKSTNKAASAAYKYLLLQTFCIPTEGDNDADAQTHDVKPSKAPANEKKAAPVGAGKRRDRMIEVLVKENNLPQAAIEDFALKSDILKAGERITDWPDDCVPSTADGMAKLVRHIGWFMQGMSVDELNAEEEALQKRRAEDPKPSGAAWKEMTVPFGKSKGIKFGAMPEDDLRWLFNEFSVKEKDAEGNPKKPAFIAKDKLIRDALDAAGAEKGWTK